MNKKIFFVPIYIWVSFIFSSALFVLFPQIDITVTSYFYTHNRGFTANGSVYEFLLYHSIDYVVVLSVVIPVVFLVYNSMMNKNVLNMNKKVVLYLLLVLAIAPGLIVNELFKEHWGRARPAETTLFGGTKQFTPAFILSNQGGNSFSCGHASAAFYLIAFALLAKKRRTLWMSLAVGYGIAISYVRIAAGGHFFSDTVVSFFIVYITILIMNDIFFKKEINEVS